MAHDSTQSGGNLLDLYLRTRRLSANARRAYRYDLKELFGTPEVTSERAGRARFTHVRAHLEAPEARGRKASTISRKISAMRAFCPDLDGRAGEDKICERLDGIGAHALRHTGCTTLTGAGAKPHPVQTYARHAAIRTTQRYVHQQEPFSGSATDYVKL
jgi:site-specific recombinase XerD